MPAFNHTRTSSRAPLIPGLFLLGSLLTMAACSGPSQLDSVDAGRTFSYIPGTPNFDLEAIATWREGSAGVDVYVSIPHNTLAYVQNGEAFVANYELIIQLLDEEGESLVTEEILTRTRTVPAYDSTQTFEPFLTTRRIAAGTGIYIVQVALEDNNAETTAYRAQRVQVVDISSAEPALSNIRLEARDGDGPFEPILAPHLSESLDSLRAVVEQYNAPDRLEVSMVLLQPETDNEPAELPYWFQLRDQRYTYQGLDFRRADTLQVSRRTLTDPAQELTIEFILPQLAEGVYRVEIRAIPEGAEDPLTVQRRDFTVKGESFPQIATLDEMVDALVYIARDRELRAMREAPTPEEKRQAFEAFWLKIGRNEQMAADLIKRYYSRVEEANLLFSSHKRGWKTDQGMVFIVMGPPNYIDQRYGDGRRLFVWRYPPPKQSSAPMGYYPTDPQRSPVSLMETRFIFEEARKLDDDIPYPQYILRRNRIYQRIWEDAVSLWRSGRVL